MGAEASAVETIGVVTYALKTPRLVVYSVDSSDLAKDWASGHERDRPGVRVKFGSRVVLQLAKGTTLDQVMRGSLLKPDREFAPGLFILQAQNVKVALEESQRLAKSRNVLVSHPVRRRPIKKMAPMAPRPNDPLFPTQWPLENRDRETGAGRSQPVREWLLASSTTVWIWRTLSSLVKASTIFILILPTERQTGVRWHKARIMGLSLRGLP